MSTSPYSNPSQTPGSERSNDPIDEEIVQRAKQEIQGLVQEVVELSKSEVDPAEFYEALLDRSVSALAAVGGVVWMLDENTGLQLEHQINLRQTGLAESEEAQRQHGRLLTRIIAKGEPMLVAPHSGSGGEEVDGDEPAANPTDYLLVVAPIMSDQGVDGLVEVFQRAGTQPTTQRGYLRFLVQICELAGEYLKTRRLRHFATKQTLWEQLESFTALVHQHLHSRSTAYTIANEGRRLIGCDRVTVVLRKGAKYHVSAISGQDTFDKRSNVVRLLRDLATTVARTGDDLWFTGDTSDLAPQVEKSVNAYVDESHTKQLAVLPLREEEEPEEEEQEQRKERRENILGAIVIEQLVDSRPPEGLMQRVDVVRRHSCTALANAHEHEGLFLMPLWRLLGKTRWLVSARTLPKTVSAAVLFCVAILVLCFVPKDFTVVSDGKLLPEKRSDVFAGLDGMVTEVLVSHGQQVKQGQILARQKSIELEDRITQLNGEHAATMEQIASARKQRQSLDRSQATDVDYVELTGQITQLSEQVKSLRERQRLLGIQRKMLEITSPIDGKVVTWKVRELIENRPVRKGHRLIKVADPSSPWELEVYVPEAKMGHIVEHYQQQLETDPEAKLRVTFILATHPSEHLEGEVVEMDTSAEIHGESGNTVRMRVSFHQEDLKKLVADPVNELKVGADVKAKVYCGRRSVGYVLFSDLLEFIQSRIRFRYF